MKNLRLGPTVISVIVTIGFFMILTVLVTKPIQFDDKVAQLLNILLGNLSTLFAGVVHYHIGSSSGSQSKDDILADQLKGKPNA